VQLFLLDETGDKFDESIFDKVDSYRRRVKGNCRWYISKAI